MIEVEQEWLGFERKVLSKAAPAIQRREMKLAFYAGFHLALLALLAAAKRDEDYGVESMEDLYRQCREFSELVKMGAV